MVWCFVSGDRGIYPGLHRRHFGRSDAEFDERLRNKQRGPPKSIPIAALAAKKRQNKADAVKEFNAMTAARPLKPPGK